MKIDVRALKKYGKLIQKFVDTGHPQFSNLYLDFAEQRIYFGSQRGFGIVNMLVEDADPKAKPFCVNALNFLAVAEEFPLLDVEGYVFRHGDSDSFQIAHVELEDFEYPDFGIDLADAVAINKNYIPAIRRAGSFTDPEGAKSIDGVFIKNGHIYGLDKLRMYEEIIPDADEDNFDLPRNVWEILVLEILEEPILKIDEAHIWVKADDIQLQFPVCLELELPSNIYKPEFAAQYAHPTKVKVGKNMLTNVIQFFLPFVSDVVSSRLQFIFNTDNLEIKTEDGNVISRRIPYADTVDPGYFNGIRIWVSAVWMKNVLAALPIGKDIAVEIAVDFDKKKPAMDFRVADNDSIHIVYSRLKDGA
jgi:hypothetical protein